MKRITSLSLAILMVCSLILSLSGCGVSESAVIGVWESTGEYDGPYLFAQVQLYVYKDGTCDYRGSWGASEAHGDKSTWEIDGDYLVITGPEGEVKKYTIQNNSLLDSQENVAYTKISDDPSVDAPLKTNH